jgi:hypothetical protein
LVVRKRSMRGSNDRAAPARGKEERNTACNVGTDLGAKCLESPLEQRPQQDGQDDQVEEGSRRCREALRGEGGLGPKLVGLRDLAQKPGRDLGAEIARRAANAARQIGESMDLGNGQPQQPHLVAVQSPPQQGKARAHEALLNRSHGRHVAFELLHAGDNVARHHGSLKTAKALGITIPPSLRTAPPIPGRSQPMVSIIVRSLTAQPKAIHFSGLRLSQTQQ